MPAAALRRRPSLFQSAHAAILLGVALVGCASGPRRNPDTDPRAIAIEVDNNLIPASALTVWAVPDGGTQMLVGNVGPSERKTLRYLPTTRALNFRLRARMTGGQDRLSNPITMIEGARVTWNVQSNLATVTSESNR